MWEKLIDFNDRFPGTVVTMRGSSLTPGSPFQKHVGVEWGSRRGRTSESRLFMREGSRLDRGELPFQFSAFPAPDAARDGGGPGPWRVSIERIMRAAAEAGGPHPDLELGAGPYLSEPSGLPRAGERSSRVCPEVVKLGQAGSGVGGQNCSRL